MATDQSDFTHAFEGVTAHAFGGYLNMKFLEVAHPEGGRFLVHIDHITRETAVLLIGWDPST